jgi:hypothetical protein
MFNTSIIASIMNMYADIYIQQNSQDPETGAIVREWVYDKTVQCKIEPIKSRGTNTKGDNKIFTAGDNAKGGYDENLQLKFKGLQLLSKRWRIANIKSSDGRQVFIEIDKYGQPDSIFEVSASHAVLDPFGRLSYYEASLHRVPVQDNDKTINRS